MADRNLWGRWQDLVAGPVNQPSNFQLLRAFLMSQLNPVLPKRGNIPTTPLTPPATPAPFINQTTPYRLPDMGEPGYEPIGRYGLPTLGANLMNMRRPPMYSELAMIDPRFQGGPPAEPPIEPQIEQSRNQTLATTQVPPEPIDNSRKNQMLMAALFGGVAPALAAAFGGETGLAAGSGLAQGFGTQYNKEMELNKKLSEDQTVSVVDPNTGEIRTITVPRGRVLVGNEARENRLSEEQKLRQSRYEFDRIRDFGGEIDDEGIKTLNKTIGADITPQLEAGRGIPSINRETGKRTWRVLSDKEWAEKLPKRLEATEIEHLQKLQTERRAWEEVKSGLEELGITANTAGKIEFDVVNSPIGPISIPARFNLAGQYLQDPKYTALKKKIERSFQAFRNRVTGAQASDKELERLRPLIASLKDRPEVFFATIDDLSREAGVVAKDRLDVYKRAGRDISGFEGYFDDNSPFESDNISNKPISGIGGIKIGKYTVFEE